MSTLPATISKSSEATAIIIASRPDAPDALETSYKTLGIHIDSFQKRLAELGLGNGDAVSIVVPNCYAFIVSFLAASYQRLRAAPLNCAYKDDEFDFYFQDLAPALIVIPEGDFEKDGAAVRVARNLGIAIAECYWNGEQVALDMKSIGGLEQRSPQSFGHAESDDIALVLHTSGTTGRPKAVPLSHRNLTRTMYNIQQTYKLTPEDRTIIVMPLFHVHGLLAALLAPLYSGGSVIVPGSFSATSFWQDFIRYQANWYTAVPTIHAILLRSPHPETIPPIRFIRSSSSALSPTVFHDLERTFKAPVLESYGMTEACHQMTSNPLPHEGTRRPGSVGIAKGLEVKIIDMNGQELPVGVDDEICIRGENIMKGYIANPRANNESFTSDGFFRTGDQGRIDKDGYLSITGRIKELINRAGEKISPIEIDQLVTSMSCVAEACSFAIPSEMYGEEVGLAVVPKAGTAISEEEVREVIQSRVVKFKVPKRVSTAHVYEM